MTDRAGPRSHFTQVFAWSEAARIDRKLVLLSLLATAAPVAAGWWLQRPGLGEIIALGAVLMAQEPAQPGGSDHGSMLAALLTAGAALAVASVLARLPGTDALMIAAVACAATLVNYSRPAAVAGVRFIVLLVLNLELIGAHGVHGGAALLFGIGVLWRLVLQLLARHWRANQAALPATAAGRTPTARQRRAHLRRQLGTLHGWHYALRLAAGLAAACYVRAVWPQHHVDWLVLAIVLMTPRTIEHFPVAVTQRALGTLAGVALAGAIAHAGLPYGALLVLLCLCGTLAPLARRGNYAAYCVLSTPLILLAMDASGPVGDGMLADRLAATLLGVLLVASANLAMDGLLRLARR